MLIHSWFTYEKWCFTIVITQLPRLSLRPPTGLQSELRTWGVIHMSGSTGKPWIGLRENLQETNSVPLNFPMIQGNQILQPLWLSSSELLWVPPMVQDLRSPAKLLSALVKSWRGKYQPSTKKLEPWGQTLTCAREISLTCTCSLTCA